MKTSQKCHKTKRATISPNSTKNPTTSLIVTMKKNARRNNRSEISLTSVRSDVIVKDENHLPMDSLVVKILNLRLNDEDPKHFTIKVTFFDQLILSNTLKSIGARENATMNRTIASGVMTYDPADYEKMCLFADYPLVVYIQPLESVIESSLSSNLSTNLPRQCQSPTASNKSGGFIKPVADISCCIVDILPLFLNQNRMCVKKRMQPVTELPLLLRKSWQNLPLLTMELSIIRNKANTYHHSLFKEANLLYITLLGSYNMIIPYNNEYTYMAASKIPTHNETNTSLVVFNHGTKVPKRFNWNSFYPKWESLRLGDDIFTTSDEKFSCNFRELHNEGNIDLAYYLSKEPSNCTTVWGSFRRTILLENTERWLWKHLRRHLWPFEIHICGDRGGYIFMAFLNLTRLLYPGENVVRLAVPLHWINSEMMQEKCGCENLLTSNDKASSTAASAQKPSKVTDQTLMSTSTDTGIVRPTGMDNRSAFIIVEVKLARSLIKIAIPPRIHNADLLDMLKEMEKNVDKRECTGRGQLDGDWQSTVRTAGNFLKKIPYYGITEFYSLNRQLSETRTHVELSTSFWQEAAIYVNNNFVVQEYLKSDVMFEELLMMAHASLMRIACDTLMDGDSSQNLDSTLVAARNARQMQDTSHAVDLYLKIIVQKPHEANIWRELSTCLKDIDSNRAHICLNKSLMLNPRDPLTLLCKACAVFEEDKCAAELFFTTLLTFYPFWPTAWVVASTYYMDRELFYMSDQIMEYKEKTQAERLTEDLGYLRAWSHELGDWWDHTPLLPGVSAYYDAADFLLRIRAISLAELCVARGLSETGESPVYFHLLALCCRLRGNIDDALCHIKIGLEKYGETSYLRNLEAECYYKQNKTQESIASFEKSGSCVSTYNILLSIPIREPQRARSVLVDLVRQQPSAYTWMALADDWIMRSAMGEGGDAGISEEQEAAKSCAAACAVQALVCDRRTGRAWALLAALVKTSARRLHCIDMANSCGYGFSKRKMESKSASQQTVCHRLDVALKECQCKWCHDYRL